MADRTTEALELALQLLAAVEHADVFVHGDIRPPGMLMEIRDTLAGALSAIRQQPVQIGSAGLAVLLRRELSSAGSETALAKRMGITRQSVSDVLSGRRTAGPAILAYLQLRKVTTTRFEHADPEPKSEPKPRSERRQRAWDMVPAAASGSSPN